MCRRCKAKVIGIALLSFGAGILLSFFLPEKVLIVTEALLLAAVSLLCLLQR